MMIIITDIDNDDNNIDNDNKNSNNDMIMIY